MGGHCERECGQHWAVAEGIWTEVGPSEKSPHPASCWALQQTRDREVAIWIVAQLARPREHWPGPLIDGYQM